MIQFTIPGEPRPWGRTIPRPLKSGRIALVTDGQTRRNEKRWEDAGAEAMDGRPPLDFALVVVITAQFLPPKSASKRKRAEMLAGEITPTRRPDSDNLAKNLDGLNGVVFRDDALITRLVVDKVYAETAGVHVLVRPRHSGSA